MWFIYASHPSHDIMGSCLRCLVRTKDQIILLKNYIYKFPSTYPVAHFVAVKHFWRRKNQFSFWLVIVLIGICLLKQYKKMSRLRISQTEWNQWLLTALISLMFIGMVISKEKGYLASTYLKGKRSSFILSHFHILFVKLVLNSVNHLLVTYFLSRKFPWKGICIWDFRSTWSTQVSPSY